MPALLPSSGPLVGRGIRLDLLTEADLPEFGTLLMDAQVYEQGHLVHRCPLTADDAMALARERYLDRQGKADGRGSGRTAYAVRLVADTELGAAGTLVGTSSLVEADVKHERIHLGGTLYGRRWWGTAVNPETKLLLLTHCFDECGYGRVKIQTDVLNGRSQAAIAKLGAVPEGVARREQRREDGTFRDSVVYSITIEDWPTVRAALIARLA